MPRIRPIRDEEAGAPTDDRAAAAAYVATLTAELAMLAGRHNLPTLRYLLDLARLEAEGTSQGV